MTNEEKINSWRARLGDVGMHCKHYEFAKDAGITSSLFSRYINGHVMPGARSIDRIENTLTKMENNNVRT